METVLFAIALLFIVDYCVVSIIFFGVPKSISDTHYLWRDVRPIFGHLFTLTLWVVAFGTLPIMLSLSSPNSQWLAFISCAALAFVGAASEFKQALTHGVHYAGAYTWAVATVIWCIVNVSVFWVILGLLVGLLGFFINRMQNKTFWQEVACIVALLASILYSVL